MAGVKKDYSLELNLMFQNLKAKELDVIITRKEKKITTGNMVHFSGAKRFLKYYNQVNWLVNQELLCTREKCYSYYFKAKMTNTQAVHLVKMSNC